MQKHDEPRAKGVDLNNISASAPEEDSAVAVGGSEAEDTTKVNAKSERGRTEVSPESEKLPVSSARPNSSMDAKEE